METENLQLPTRHSFLSKAWLQTAAVFVLAFLVAVLAATTAARAQLQPGDQQLSSDGDSPVPLGYSSAQIQPREKLQAAWIDPQVGRSLPLDVPFIAHDERSTNLREVLGQRPVVLCLVYFECPMLCRLAADGVMRAVSSMSEQVGQDFDVIFISFDPRDTPARARAARDHALSQYTRAGAKAGLHFLTGSQASIDAITRAVGFHYAWDEATQQFSHAAGLMIVAPDGVITEYLDGVNFSPRSLASAVERAQRNELTQTQALAFVRCYLYDPTTGKFGAAVQWTIRALALATVAFIGAAIVRMNRLTKNAAVASLLAAPASDVSAEVRDE